MEKQRCRRIGIHTTYFSLYVFWVFKVCFKIMTELFFRMIQQDWKWQTGGTSLWRAVPAPRNWAVKNLDVCRILKAFIRLTFNADFSAADGDFYTYYIPFVKTQRFLLQQWSVVQCWPCGKTGQEMLQLMRGVAKIASSSHPQKMWILAELKIHFTKILL